MSDHRSVARGVGGAVRCGASARATRQGQALTDSSVGHWPQPLDLTVMGVWGLVMTNLAIRRFSWE